MPNSNNGSRRVFLSDVITPMKKTLKIVLCTAIVLGLAAGIVEGLRNWDRFNPIAYWQVKYGFEPFKAPHSLPESAKTEGPEIIAHAGGAIDGAVYTNSREAFLQSIAAGCRFIEIDFKETLDGKIFGAHSTREFRRRTGLPALGHFPPTTEEVRGAKIDGKYTPLFLTDIYEILKAHPDVYLVTDKTRDYDALLEQFPLPEQLIVETFELPQYYRALKAGILYPTFAGSVSELRKHGATLTVVGPNSLEQNPELLAWALEPGHTAMVLTTNTCSEVNLPRGTLLYSDFCRPLRARQGASEHKR